MASKLLPQSNAGGPSPCGTEIGDLSSELLNVIFHKLGPSPVHLAALPAVCKSWRSVMQEVTYQQLCLEIAPGLCEKMGYDVTSQPWGGWLAFFKLLLYCPGMQHLPEPYINDSRKRSSRLDDLGHVQEEACGFQTGPAVARKLLPRQRQFQQDCLFATGLCQHAWLDEDRNLAVCASRGIVQNFPNSAIAKQSAASRYADASLQEQQLMRETANNHCIYCGAPIFELRKDVFFNRHDSFHRLGRDLVPGFIPRWDDVTGQVCGNGHLTFEVFGNRPRAPFLERTPMAGSGQGTVVETCQLKKRVCKELRLPRDDGITCELKFFQDLNPYTLSHQLKCLARAIKGFILDHEEDEELREEGGSAAAKLRTMSGLIRRIARTERRIEENYQIYEDSCKEDHKDTGSKDSRGTESDTAQDEGLEEELPFWSIPSDDLGVVKDFKNESSSAEYRVFTFLRDSKPSARIVVNTHRKLERFWAQKAEAERRLELMEQERKEEIEAALTAAGVQESGGEWPLPEAVQSYIKVSWPSVLQLDWKRTWRQSGTLPYAVRKGSRQCGGLGSWRK